VTPLQISVEPEAEADLLEAYEWYERRRQGLGVEFIDCVDDAFVQVSRRPLTFAAARHGVRQALVSRFPYVVCFVVESDVASVIAVFHCRRDPVEWQSRLR
jgi:plasmid stabilization system protein ParE